jgi:hypothetical protein
MLLLRNIALPPVLLICILIFCGCATFAPRPIEEVPFKERAETQYEDNVHVTAAVLSAEESEAVFGIPLYDRKIQPIWLEVKNDGEEPLWFLPVGLDPDYFSPLEVAYITGSKFSNKAYSQIERYFYDHSMKLYVGPGGVRSGFVFTYLDMGTKNFTIDIVGEDHRVRTFTFFISVPGLRVDHQDVDWENLYSKNEIVSLHGEGLREALENLPCCTTDEKGRALGDPLNLVIIGKGDYVHRALIRARWNETATREEAASQSKTGESSLFKGAERYVPVEPFYLYGRPQDAAFRKTRETANERNQLRLWLSPMTVEGELIWVGQISRDVKGRGFRSHRGEPDVDEARFYILQDLAYTQGLARYGYVKGVGAASMSKPRGTFKGDTYFTDGLRLVMWVSDKPVSLTRVEFVEWETPPMR